MPSFKSVSTAVKDKMPNLSTTYQNAKGTISGWAKGLRGQKPAPSLGTVALAKPGGMSLQKKVALGTAAGLATTATVGGLAYMYTRPETIEGMRNHVQGAHEGLRGLVGHEQPTGLTSMASLEQPAGFAGIPMGAHDYQTVM